MSLENTSEELNYGLEKLEKRLEPYEDSNYISNWEWTAGGITGGAGYFLTDKAAESGAVEFLTQDPYQVLGAAGILAFSGALNGGASAYKKLAGQLNPSSIRDNFKEGYKKGQLNSEIEEISDVWTLQSAEEAEKAFGGRKFHSPDGNIREYLEEAEKAVGRQSRYGRVREPRKLEGEEIELFFHDIMKDIDDDSELQQTVLEEPVGDNQYAFAAFWEEDRGLIEDNEHAIFGYRTE